MKKSGMSRAKGPKSVTKVPRGVKTADGEISNPSPQQRVTAGKRGVALSRLSNTVRR